MPAEGSFGPDMVSIAFACDLFGDFRRCSGCVSFRSHSLWRVDRCMRLSPRSHSAFGETISFGCFSLPFSIIYGLFVVCAYALRPEKVSSLRSTFSFLLVSFPNQPSQAVTRNVARRSAAAIPNFEHDFSAFYV